MRWLAVILLLLSGCRTTQPPEALAFWEIRLEPYKLNVNDCSNKSSKYARILRDAGFVADIWLTKYPDGGVHAIVSVELDGRRLWCDPTNGEWSWRSDQFGELYFRIPFHSRHDEDLWGKSFSEKTTE
jgi:hypothetical protein